MKTAENALTGGLCTQQILWQMDSGSLPVKYCALGIEHRLHRGRIGSPQEDGCSQESASHILDSSDSVPACVHIRYQPNFLMDLANNLLAATVHYGH